MAPTLLTVKEFADYIRVHPRTVYRRIWTHRQAGVVRQGRDIRLDVAVALAPVTPCRIPSYGAGPALGGLFTHV